MKEVQKVSRRGFIQKAAAGLAVGVYGASASSSSAAENQPAAREKCNRLPREVWVASLTVRGLSADSSENLVSKVLKRMEEVTPYQPDIVCLPELFGYMNVRPKPPVSEIAETVPGPICKRIGKYAKKNNCYVICPIYSKQNGRVYNAAVLIDRQGEVVGEYRKARLTISEIEKKSTTPGPLKPPVFKTDFGTIGMQICFDVNWYDGWHYLRKAGAEIVFWPSAFAGGELINSLARLNKYYIVTSARYNPTRVIDVTGDELATSSHYRDWVCAPVNLEKASVHIWPYVKKFKALRAKYDRKLRIRIMGYQDWAVIESRSPEVKIAEVLKEFEIPTFEEYITQAEKAQARHR